MNIDYPLLDVSDKARANLEKLSSQEKKAFEKVMETLRERRPLQVHVLNSVSRKIYSVRITNRLRVLLEKNPLGYTILDIANLDELRRF